MFQCHYISFNEKNAGSFWNLCFGIFFILFWIVDNSLIYITSTFLFSHGHIVRSITNKTFVEDDNLGQIVRLD